MKVLELEHVYLQRGNFVLKDISFVVEEGSTVALMGRSGSGKTSLIELIGNAVLADAGRISYFGKEMCEDEREIRRRISIVYDTPNCNTELRAAKMAKEIAKFEPWFDMEGFERRMEEMGMDGAKRIKHFSRGTQKKYMLILALCRQPELLVMDEPTSGVDEQSRLEMLAMMEEYRKKHPLTILFSTHNPADVEQMATQSIWLEKGGMV